MKIKVSVLVFVWLFASSALFAQGEDSPPPPPAPIKRVEQAPTGSTFMGELKEGVYTNEFFGFSLPIPESFVVANRKELELLQKVGVEVLTDQTKKNAERLEKSIQETAVLLAVFRLPVGQPNNSGVEIGVIRQPAGVTANMALAANSALLTGSAGYEHTLNLPELSLGGLKFVGAQFERDIFGVTLKQRSYFAMRRGYSILVSVVYTNEEGLEAMQSLLNGIKFAKR
jgi:hypothetical protein